MGWTGSRQSAIKTNEAPVKVVFRPLHPLFAAEGEALDLARLHDPDALAELRTGMDQYGILVFREQQFTDPEQLEFAQRFDGVLHSKTGISALGRNRL